MWTVIASYSSPEEAYIVKGMLENNGIPVEISNATISSVYPMTDTWASVDLLVSDDNAEKARRLISGHDD